MIELTYLTPSFAVTSALSASDMETVMAMGFRSVISNLPDDEDGGPERQRAAAEFCAAYEAMLLSTYPGVALDRVLLGEELFADAYAALAASRYDEATRRFREVLNLVPRHYPSWGNLGAAYLAMHRREDAVRCLRRALELNPNYTIARENLALLATGER